MPRWNEYKLLGKSGLRVFPLSLGTLNFGMAENFGCNKNEAQELFNTYVESGGNFIDTANNYSDGRSEEFLGTFIGKKRDQLVIATKYTFSQDRYNPNACGNHRKNMMISVNNSLRRLQTDYIDLFWVHLWEYRTPIEEVLRGLDDLIRQGKILYIGFSDTPAWKVAQAHAISEIRNFTPIVATQAQYNLAERSLESDFLPMLRETNISLQPWSPLAGGLLSGKYTEQDLEKIQEKRRSGNLEGRQKFSLNMGMLSKESLTIANKVKELANSIGRTPSQVALRWLLQRPMVVSPIIGAHSKAQLEENLGALEFCLTDEQMQELNATSQIPLCFPHNMDANPWLHRFLDGENRIETPLLTRSSNP